jgi:kynurenine formamidase
MTVIDLTHPISDEMPVYFPWHPATEITRTASYKENSCEVRRVSVGSHSGTHIDAPSHIYEGMPAIDQYDPRLWYTEAMVLDFAPRKQRQAITKEEIEAKGVERGMGVVIKTGWDKNFGREDYYRTYPPISNDAAEFLAEQEISVLAADTPFTLDVHKILLKKGIPLITNINNTDRLPEGRVRLIAAPLLIRGGDGAPARVLAVLES